MVASRRRPWPWRGEGDNVDAGRAHDAVRAGAAPCAASPGPADTAAGLDNAKPQKQWPLQLLKHVFLIKQPIEAPTSPLRATCITVASRLSQRQPG